MVFGVGLIDPRCQGNEIWNKMGHNSAPFKDNCAVCTYPLFSGPGYPTVSFKFLPADPRFNGNEVWDKIDYYSVCVKDIWKIFASIGGRGSGMGRRMLPTEFSSSDPCCHGNKIWDIMG